MIKKPINSKTLNNDISVGVIGLGYVGLPLVLRFSEEEFQVTGFDIDVDKIKSLNNGKSYIKHFDNSKIEKALLNGFNATSNFEKIRKVDVIIICVPTPLGIHNEPDLSYVHSTLDLLKDNLGYNQLLILESTTYPGTTDEIIVPFLDNILTRTQSKKPSKKFIIGENFFVGYSPEREDPGNKNFTTKTIPKIVSGFTEKCLKMTENIYDRIVDKTVPVSSPKVAEMTKILENIHRAVNIGLINELKIVADKMNIDIYDVINAAATKPFGFTPYYPGPGLGGHCIPIDPLYLTWKAKELGINTRFIELAGEINTSMPNYVVQKSGEALNSSGKSINKSKILVLGLSYKKNVDDLRESPSLKILELLLEKGAQVEFSDPYFESIPITRKHNFNIKSKKINKKSLQSFDLVILATDHDQFDYNLIEEYSQKIIDTRGRFSSSNNKTVIA
tara:strand:- start:78 stop:1418 length:1341 start_codon:yes stop_codon:yes gene_type:complete